MVLRAFDFADVMLSHDALRSLPDTPALRERLAARAERGVSPPCPAALLAERGDRRFEAMLSGLAAYLDPPDMPSLGALGAVDALAAAVAPPWVPAPLRAAAADVLATQTPTPVSLCTLAEVGDTLRGGASPRPNVLAAHDALALRADEATRTAAEKLRARVKLARTWTGVRRQELQREIATGVLHPVAGLLAGDPNLLAGIVPPIADAARAALMPNLLANARDASDEARKKTFAFFHGRFRESAREPLSALARFVKLRGRDTNLPVLAVGSLAAMGAFRDVIYALASGGGEGRLAALVALEKAGLRALTEPDRALLAEAVTHLEHAGEAVVAARTRKLLASG